MKHKIRNCKFNITGGSLNIAGSGGLLKDSTITWGAVTNPTVEVNADTEGLFNNNLGDADIWAGSSFIGPIDIIGNVCKTINGNVGYQGGNVINSLWVSTNSGGGVAAHASTHEDGGSDEIDVSDLSGVLADGQKARWIRGSGSTDVEIDAVPSGDEINQTEIRGVYEQNYVKQSEDISDSVWSKSACTINGTDGVVADTSTGNHYILQYPGANINTGELCFEFEIKAEDKEFVKIYALFYEHGSTTYRDCSLWIGIKNGLVKQATRVYNLIFYKKDENTCVIKFRATGDFASGTSRLYVYAATDSSTSYTGNGSTVDIRVKRSKIGGTCSDYTKTTTAAITGRQTYKHKKVNPVYGEMYLTDNTTAMTIGYQNQYIPVTQLKAGLGSPDFEFQEAGSELSVTAVADGGSGTISCTISDTSSLSAGDIIYQYGFSDSNYNGVFKIEEVTDSTHYKVTATYTATGTGKAREPDRLICGVTGVYTGKWSISGKASSSSQTFQFTPHLNTTASSKAGRKQKFAWDDENNITGNGNMIVNKDDIISFGIMNTSGTNNITISNMTLNLNLIERLE